MIIQGAAALLGGLFFLVAGIVTLEIGAILIGATISAIAGGSLWLALRKGGPHHFGS